MLKTEISPISPLGSTNNGIVVEVNLASSHAATHLKETPALFDLLREVIPKFSVHKNEESIEFDFRRIIGVSDLVETSPQDEIFYALRPNRVIYARFVENREPHPTSWLSLILQKRTDLIYSLYTAWVGRQTPGFPGGIHATPQSKEFWSHHALALGRQEIIQESKTKRCPW